MRDTGWGKYSSRSTPPLAHDLLVDPTFQRRHKQQRRHESDHQYVDESIPCGRSDCLAGAYSGEPVRQEGEKPKCSGGKSSVFPPVPSGEQSPGRDAEADDGQQGQNHSDVPQGPGGVLAASSESRSEP